MNISKEELHMFRAGKKLGMSKMLGVVFISMIPSAAICGFFCRDVGSAIAVFSTLVLTICFAYTYIFEPGNDQP